MRKFVIIFLLLTLPFLQGCAVFAASQMGYYEAKSKYSKQYDVYKLENEAINAERRKYGLPSEPLKEFNEWVKEQPLAHYEIKAFKIRGVLSPEEAKAIRERQGL